MAAGQLASKQTTGIGMTMGWVGELSDTKHCYNATPPNQQLRRKPD